MRRSHNGEISTSALSSVVVIKDWSSNGIVAVVVVGVVVIVLVAVGAVIVVVIAAEGFSFLIAALIQPSIGSCLFFL